MPGVSDDLQQVYGIVYYPYRYTQLPGYCHGRAARAILATTGAEYGRKVKSLEFNSLVEHELGCQGTIQATRH